MFHLSPSGGSVERALLSPDRLQLSLSMRCLLLEILMRSSKRTQHISMSRLVRFISVCAALFCSVINFLPVPPPPHLSSNPLLFLSSYCPHDSLVPHCSPLCFSHLVSGCQSLCSMNTVSAESQVGVNSVINELLLQAEGLCKCLFSGKPGKFVQWQQLPPSKPGGSDKLFNAFAFEMLVLSHFTKINDQPLNSVTLYDGEHLRGSSNNC